MIKFRLLISLSFSIIMVYGSLPDLYAQKATPVENKIISEKKRLMILPSKSDDQESHSIDKEVTNVVASIATQLGRFEVIDRNNLKSILEEQALQLTGVIDDSMVVNIGNIAAAKEAFIVTVLNFSQKGVPPSEKKDEEDEEEEDGRSIWGDIIVAAVKGIFQRGSKEDDEKYPNNIQTQLSVQVRKINIETGKSLHSFDVDVVHTGGTRGKSRAKVMNQFRKKAIRELKKLYLLTSEVISVDGREVLLFLGTDIGVRKGTVFEIVGPDRIRTFENRHITVPGRTAGFVSVEDISGESNRSVILRQWRPIKSGYRALEYPKSIPAFQVDIFPPLAKSYFGLGIQFRARPIHSLDWGLSLRFIQVTDSFDDKDLGFGFGVFGGKRILHTPRFTLMAKLGTDLDLPFREDNKSHIVTTALFSTHLGINAEILLSANSDLVTSAGYHFVGKSSDWHYSEGEETHPGVWNKGPPKVDISGFFLTVGYKFTSF